MAARLADNLAATSSFFLLPSYLPSPPARPARTRFLVFPVLSGIRFPLSGLPAALPRSSFFLLPSYF
jgi:hypothetical protein